MRITVIDSLGEVKAIDSKVTVVGGGKYGASGFAGGSSVRPKDRVAFRSDDGYSADMDVGSMKDELDPAADTVSRLLYAPWHTEVLAGQVRNFRWWGMSGLPFTADPNGGHFSVDVAPHDIISGTKIGVCYCEPDGNEIHRSFTAVEPSALGFDIGVNYVNDWVNGHCEAGHPMEISVRDSTGTLDASGIVTSALMPGWDGDTGFEGSWVEGDTPPEIDPGDGVDADADNGESRTIYVGTIKGQTRAGYGRVEGSIDAPWLEDVVPVTCAGWEGAPEGIPRKEA